jgi:hypothetical protein
VKVDINAIHSELSEIGWRGYGSWTGEQLDRFRGSARTPSPPAEPPGVSVPALG